jgi:hypothetical protein
VWLLGRAGQFLRPKLAAAWRNSGLRARYLILSKAQLVFAVGLAGNLLVVLLCLPLLRIPEGTAIKPMALPALMVGINAGSIVLWRRLTADGGRPDGSPLLRLVGLLLCLTPFILGAVLMNLFAAVRGLEFG